MKTTRKMKKMKLIGLIALVAVLGNTNVLAQSDEKSMRPIEEYKLDMSSGRLIVKEVNRVEFIGHSGSGVIFKSSGRNSRASQRAEGLKLINGLGLVDNTGLGLSIEKDGDANIVRQVSQTKSREYIIQVPKGVTVVYEHSSPYGRKVVFRDFLGEIESTTNHSGVRLENVTGPISISTVHGNIDGSFTNVNQVNPISIVSSHGDIDLSLPVNTKANLKIETSWGEIYSDLDIKIEQKDGSMKRYRGNKVAGTLNGGGVDFQIKSTHGTIYLRKK